MKLDTEPYALQTGVLREQFPLGEEKETKLGEICPEARKLFPFYFKLPYSDPVALLKWRIYVRKQCVHDLKFRAAINEMCRRDVAFYIVTFCSIFEPRPFPHKLPFFLWPDQVSVLAWWEMCFGKRSSGSEKTRGIGFSWLGMGFLKHKWDYVPGCQIALISEDTDKLSGGGTGVIESNSLLGKLQFLHDNLPAWMQVTRNGQPKLYRLGERMMFVNRDNAALFQGFSSRQAKLRSLRFTVIFADELAFYSRADQDEWNTSAFGTCPCVMAVSTWNGFEDLFHEFMYGAPSSMLRIRAFWWNNPERHKGAYRMIHGQVDLVDKTYNWAKEHSGGFRFGEPEVSQLDGKLRSPWIDATLAEPGKMRDILKTLRDFWGREVCEHTNTFFQALTLDAVRASVQPPEQVGLLDVEAGVVSILPTHKGNLRTWSGVPVIDHGPYTMFLDSGVGTGAAHSVANVVDSRGEQVLQYGRNDRHLTDFVADCVLLARWLAGENGDGWVKIDFESNGGFSNTIRVELERAHYGNVHLSDKKQPKANEALQYAGTINRDGGLVNFLEFQRAILAMETRVRAEEVLNDMRMMGRNDKDQPEFPANQKCGHGDYLHALAGAWWRARATARPQSVVKLEIGPNDAPPWENRDFGPAPCWSDAWSNA